MPPSTYKPLVMLGMHGMGDNLHERAIVRELLRSNELWLKTSWPQMYWDMGALQATAPPSTDRDSVTGALIPASGVRSRLHLLPLGSPIRAMAKNEVYAAGLYGASQPPHAARVINCGYSRETVKAAGSVLGAMAKVCGVPVVGDFRMPIAPQWRAKADALLKRIGARRPLLVYRPPIVISEINRLSSQAKVARNPDLAASHALISAIRKDYFVVSLADCKAGAEWLVGPQIKADAEFHHGDLDFETIAAVTARADLVFCSPGFMTVLAQAVSAPMICVFGGFEGKESFSPGARFSPWLPIEPIKPCACWNHSCTHDKTIDVSAAHQRIARFLADISEKKIAESPVTSRAWPSATYRRF